MVEENIVQDAEAVQPTEPEPSKTVFSIEILRLLRDAQKQHGLRHGDYQRYRGNILNSLQNLPDSVKNAVQMTLIRYIGSDSSFLV